MQMKLNLDLDQTDYVQYKLNMPYSGCVNDCAEKDYMVRRYLQLKNLDLPSLTPHIHSIERTELRDLEAGSKYYEIQDFYTKFKILKAVPVPADDVLIAHSDVSANSISRWNNYHVCVNWYIQNWGTMYQYYDQSTLVDQFRPDDCTLWALDLTQPFQTVNLDSHTQTRTFVSWLYKNITINQLLAEWTSYYK